MASYLWEKGEEEEEEAEEKDKLLFTYFCNAMKMGP